jgi:hypothetical protein
VGLNLALYQLVHPEQVAGIEVEEFAARIAEAALWLMDHQLNLALSARSAVAVAGLPASAPIDVLDALGRSVAHATADDGGTARLTLPAELAAGMYLVRSGSQTRRLTVE